MSDARNKHIEEMISSPYNKCAIAYTEDRAKKSVVYFINIKSRKNEIEKVIIDESEVAYWNGVIKKADLERADKKKQVSQERREKRDRKIELLGKADDLEAVKRLDPAIDEDDEVKTPILNEEDLEGEDEEVAE